MDLEVRATGLKFPEGPVWMSDGSVLLVEIERGTLSRVDSDGAIDVVAELDGGPNGVAIGPDGAAYVCNNGGCFTWVDFGGITIPGALPPTWKGGSIQRVDLETGDFETIYAESNGHGLRAPNDLVFDAHGGFWFTDHGVRAERTSDRTGVHYARADGSQIEEAIFPLDAPNGVGLSPSGDAIYVAETHTGRLWSWSVTAPGVAEADRAVPNAGGELLCGLPGNQLFDSLAVDSGGNVCVGTLVNGGITVVSPDGASVEQVDLPDMLVTNICFGGPDRSTAFATLSGTGQLVAFEWPRPGLALAHER